MNNRIEETLVSARQRLARNLDEGVNCPCCGQFAKRYKRYLGASIAYPLMLLYKHGKRATDGWVDIRSLGLRGGDYAKAIWWKLIEKHDVEPGLNRLTADGKRFVEGDLKVPAYMIVYNNELTGEVAPDKVGIKDALGEKYDYAKLMRPA